MPEQTMGKHIVLRAYLGAWMGILGQRVDRMVFIDGFAGPGEYEGGEPGSPLIALDVFERHIATDKFRAKPTFLFLEEHQRRHENLIRLVAPYIQRLGSRAQIQVETGRFDTTLGRLLDQLDSSKLRLAPSFVMVDPFGVSHLPMSLTERILRNPSAEVFVSFMYESINRHRGQPEFEPHLNELFGTPDWREMDTIPDSSRRKDFVLQLYEKQLRVAGAKFVSRVELWDGNRFIYAIYFATKHALGCDRMKAAIWKADPSGSYQFRREYYGQQLIFGPDFNLLKRQLRMEFGGQEYVPIETIAAWIQTDATLFHSGQLKKALKEMEAEATIQVDSNSRPRRGTYPDGALILVIPM